MYYKRPYCSRCKLIWGKTSILRIINCNKCGKPLVLKDFNPYKKSLLGLLVIVLGLFTLFVGSFMWFGGFL